MATSTLGSGTVVLAGTTSGTTTVTATAVAGTTTLTLPAATDTLVGKATTDTLTNKTLTSATLTGVVTFDAGTAAAPAITTTGDTNTGIFFPAADTIAFSEGGVEAMRIASTGDVGIGTTSPSAPIDVVSNSSAIGTRIRGRSSDSYGVLEFTNNAASAETARIAADSSNNLIFSNTGSITERMRIDSSGNVGIGTSSPTALLTAGSLSDGTPATYGGTIKVASATQTSINSVGGIELNVATGYSTKIQQISSGGANLTFCGRQSSATWSEYMRIDPSGNLLVGTTSTIQSGLFSVLSAGTPAGFTCSASASAGVALDLSRTAATGDMVYLRTSTSTLAGFISCPTSNTTTYNSVSDYRLKENIAPMTGALEKISSLKPCTYTWKSDGAAGQGFIAHELQAIVPDCVVGIKDAVDENGDIKPQGVDTSFLVATLTAAIQEQQALITSLTTRITALEQK